MERNAVIKVDLAAQLNEWSWMKEFCEPCFMLMTKFSAASLINAPDIITKKNTKRNETYLMGKRKLTSTPIANHSQGFNSSRLLILLINDETNALCVYVGDEAKKSGRIKAAVLTWSQRISLPPPRSLPYTTALNLIWLNWFVRSIDAEYSSQLRTK